MNERFRNFLEKNSWLRGEEGYYIKTYFITFLEGDKAIPIRAYFNFYKEEDPASVTLEPMPGFMKLRPTARKRLVRIEGSDRIIANLNNAGLCVAIKASIFGFTINSFRREAKLAVEKSNELPT